MTDTCQHTCPPRRSRLLTPIAIVVGAVLLSGTSAYAASQITGAQIKNSTITSVDVKNSSLTGADVKNSSLTGADVKDSTLTGADVKAGTVTGSDLAAGLANRLTAVSTRQFQSADLASGSSVDWQWVLPTSELLTYKVTNLQRFTVQGIVGYKTPTSQPYDVAVCSSVNGSAPSRVGPTYGTITPAAAERFNVPVQGETTASGVTLRLGPCLRSSVAGALIADVSSFTVWMTNP